jgi:hypothetical protein
MIISHLKSIYTFLGWSSWGRIDGQRSHCILSPGRGFVERTFYVERQSYIEYVVQMNENSFRAGGLNSG